MDGSRGKGGIFSDENAFFSFWFHSINLRYPGVGVSKDDQDKIDAKKADKANRIKKLDEGIEQMRRMKETERTE